MSIPLYDMAISQKIKNWVLDPKMTILSPNETRRFFNEVADRGNDKIALPLISISRERDVDILLKASRYAEKTGKVFNAGLVKADGLRHVPIILRYQIDIYTRYEEEANEYARNFIFNLIDYPTLKINIPYNNSKLESTSFIELEGTYQDNSDIPERLIPGQFTRITLGIKLKDAQLYAYNIKDIPHIVDIKDQINQETPEDILD